MEFNESQPFYTNIGQKKPPFFEALLLFLVFFFPGYLGQNSGFHISQLFSPEFHLGSLVFTLPQLLLMLYIIGLRLGPLVHGLGIRPFESRLLPRSLLTLISLLAITFGLGALLQLFNYISDAELYNPTLAPGKMSISYSEIEGVPFIAVLILATSLCIAYLEELFFRVYLIGQFGEDRRSTIIVVLLSSALFAAGHLYQGLVGGMGTFLIGLFLSLSYIRRRSWHEISIAHGLYNFIIIMLAPLTY
ncbi:MAG TPA: CPBP family intramembrane metalloprotease [Sediminispirochaeta sp.]|nr:CPBP family intramembrane metalloprotease [Sediminispirochaeta sp.]